MKKNKLDEVLPLPPFNAKLARKALVAILKDEIEKTGLKKGILGLSGGVDSALSLCLAVEALGAQNVTAVYMPYKLSSENSLKHAKILTEQLQVPSVLQEITDMADGYFNHANHSDGISKLRMGNVLARLRMVVLYDLSSKYSSLVVGTSNKTEMFLGYSTLWGDMASAVNPLGDLFKSQIFALSKEMNVPSEILNKAPSADLWEGQTDEDELNISYDLADRILYHLIDRQWSVERIKEKLLLADVESSKADLVMKKIVFTQFKRKMPVIAKVSHRTVDREFRYPRDWML